MDAILVNKIETTVARKGECVCTSNCTVGGVNYDRQLFREQNRKVPFSKNGVRMFHQFHSRYGVEQKRKEKENRMILFGRGLARTQVPATRNCTVELFTFGIIAGVSPSGVQCKSLALEEAPW